jgi:hypothetical protein
MRKEPPCSEWAEKLALRQQDLSPAERAALEAHLKSCSVCRTAQVEYCFLDAYLRALPSPTLLPFPRLAPHGDDQDE